MLYQWLLAALQSSSCAGPAFAVGVSSQLVCCAESFGSGLLKSFKCFWCNSSLLEKYRVQYCTISLLIIYE